MIYSKQELEAQKVFGLTRTAQRFKNEGDTIKQPIVSKKNGWVLRFFNERPHNTSDYILYREEDVQDTIFYDSIPVIEFNCNNYPFKFNHFNRNIIMENIPKEALDVVEDFIKEPLKKSERYLKMYIAVLDEVNDYMVPTLVAHSMLGAHLEFGDSPIDAFHNRSGSLYTKWLTDSFRKCVVKVNRKEFEKIKSLGKVYLGHENTTLNGEKSCAIPYPVWSDDVPKVLKFSKLWRPSCIDSYMNKL